VGHAAADEAEQVVGGCAWMRGRRMLFRDGKLVCEMDGNRKLLEWAGADLAAKTMRVVAKYMLYFDV
jgi:hypothetical protein